MLSRRVRLVLVALTFVVASGCGASDPWLCAQLGQLGFCNS